MKTHFLTLLLLGSCGKAITPPPQDLLDEDGDQTRNAYEHTELSKYLAEVDPVPPIEGQLRFFDQKFHEVPVTNKENLGEHVTALLVDPTSRRRGEEYFTEWSRLRMKETSIPGGLTQERYSLNLTLKLREESSYELLIRRGLVADYLAPLTENMSLDLSREDLQDLFSGKSTLEVAHTDKSRGAVQESIKAQTYRVFVKSEREARVYYVSRRLSLEKLLRALKVPSPRDIELEDLFFTKGLSPVKQWWIRKIDSDVVLVQATLSDLSAAFEKSLSASTGKISRANGTPSGTLRLKKNLRARAFFTIRPTMKTLTFLETETKVRQLVPRGGSGFFSVASIPCVQHRRKVTAENPALPVMRDLLDSLTIIQDGQEVSPAKQSFRLTERKDEKGLYWQLMLDLPAENLELSLKPSPASTYRAIGLYKVTCARGSGIWELDRTTRNVESEFTLNEEAFVEKGREK